MQQTTHYSLKKPEENDYADIAALSEDMDIIDEELYKKADSSDSHIKTYSSFADLGLSGEITPEQLFNAMPVGSNLMAACNPDAYLANPPGDGNAYGNIVVWRPGGVSLDIEWHEPTSGSGEIGGVYKAQYRTLSTPSWTGWRKVKLLEAGQENDLKTFTSLAQIGITAGQETIESVSQALPDNSMITYGVGASNNQVVYAFAYGVVTVQRTDSSRVVWTMIENSTARSATGIWNSATGFSGWTTNTETVTGVYTGDGTASRTINLGFKPKAVLVLYEGRVIWNYDVYGGLVFEGYPTKSGEYVALEVASNGFIVHTNGNGCSTNDNNGEYHYIAFK
nr:hypothetical protein [uncultured Agathobaculum sp.]